MLKVCLGIQAAPAHLQGCADGCCPGTQGVARVGIPCHLVPLIELLRRSQQHLQPAATQCKQLAPSHRECSHTHTAPRRARVPAGQGTTRAVQATPSPPPPASSHPAAYAASRTLHTPLIAALTTRPSGDAAAAAAAAPPTAPPSPSPPASRSGRGRRGFLVCGGMRGAAGQAGAFVGASSSTTQAGGRFIRVRDTPAMSSEVM